jgi:hypothetical protein
MNADEVRTIIQNNLSRYSGFALESCVENNVQDNVPVNITNIVWYSVWHDVHTNILVNVGNVVRAMSPHMLKQILNEC